MNYARNDMQSLLSFTSSFSCPFRTEFTFFGQNVHNIHFNSIYVKLQISIQQQFFMVSYIGVTELASVQDVNN